MAIFPALEPFRRSYSLPDFPVEDQDVWPGVTVRYSTGFDAMTVTGAVLKLDYVDLREDQMQLIRNHYNTQIGSTVKFTLPGIIWQGSSGILASDTLEWNYADQPSEDQRKGGLFDVTVELESAELVVGLPIASSSFPAVLGPATTAGVWLTVDLGEATSFQSVVVGGDVGSTVDGGAWGPEYAEGALIQGSNDGVTWTTIGTTGTFSGATQSVSTPDSSYQFVRIGYEDAGASLVVTEFSVSDAVIEPEPAGTVTFYPTASGLAVTDPGITELSVSGSLSPQSSGGPFGEPYLAATGSGNHYELFPDPNVALATDPFTIEVWYRNPNAQSTIFRIFDGVTFGVQLNVNTFPGDPGDPSDVPPIPATDPIIQFTINGFVNDVQVVYGRSSLPVLNEWRHFAICGSSSTVRAWDNGQELTTINDPDQNFTWPIDWGQIAFLADADVDFGQARITPGLARYNSSTIAVPAGPFFTP